MLGIVVSRADEASVHIGDQLRELADWTAHQDDRRPDAAGGGTVYRTPGVELREFDRLHIELERPADAFDGPDLLAFASRHSGETGPLLTAHHTGNVGPAEFGGAPNQLATAAPGALSAALDAFERHAPDGYDIGLECTHHGPTEVGVPSLFVEVGSEAEQWRDSAAASTVARAILQLRDVDPRLDRTFVGVGGGHYAPRFTRIVRETDWAVGHVLADWGLRSAGELSDELLQQAFERSGAELAVIDGEHPALADRIERLGFRIVGESWLRETTGVALGVVERLEAELSTVGEGLRLGRLASGADPDTPYRVVEPAADLLADANGIDAQRVRAVVADEAVAYETIEAGNRVTGRIAVPDRAAWKRIETGLVDLLAERFDDVTLATDEIVVTERAFDPDGARELGVEPGPAFGTLAGGESVTVDGEEIDPEMVHETRTRRYPR